MGPRFAFRLRIDQAESAAPLRRRAGASAIGIFPIVAFAYFLIRYRSVGYACAGAVLLALGFLLARRPDPPRFARLGAFAFAGLGILLAAGGLIQFLAGCDLGDLDQAFYSNALWNFRHGRFGYSYAGMNVLGIHALYLSAAFWTPVHILFGETGLKLGGGLCLIAAAWLSVRRFAPRGIAGWGAAALLLSPSFASQFFFGFHLEIVGAPLFILALDAYREERLGRFVACAAALAYCKEAFVLAVAGLLLLAAIERRPRKWIVLPALVCGVQMAVYWYGIVPAFAPAGNFLRGFFPASPSQVAALWFRPETAGFAFRSVLPYLPVMAILPKRYWVLPIPLILFYASFPDPLFRIPWQHYHFPIALCCWGGVALAGGGNAPVTLPAPLARAFAACALGALLCYPLWREVQILPAGALAKIAGARALETRVPGSSSVLINYGATSRFAARAAMGIWGSRSVWGRRAAPPSDYDFVLLDGRFRPAWLTDPEDLRAGIEALSAAPGWELAYARDSMFLFRNRRSRPAVGAIFREPD